MELSALVVVMVVVDWVGLVVVVVVVLLDVLVVVDGVADAEGITFVFWDASESVKSGEKWGLSLTASNACSIFCGDSVGATCSTIV